MIYLFRSFYFFVIILTIEACIITKSLYSQKFDSSSNSFNLEVINNNQIKRSFQLVVGLQEGYESKITHNEKEVQKIISNWLFSQKTQNKPYLPGQIISGTMIYIHDTPCLEPVLTYMGDISPLYNSEYQDQEIIEALCELASLLSHELKQKRIYLSYRDKILILQNRFL